MTETLVADENKDNSLKELIAFFGCDTKEFMPFWKSLTDEEKAEFKTAKLT